MSRSPKGLEGPSCGSGQLGCEQGQAGHCPRGRRSRSNSALSLWPGPQVPSAPVRPPAARDGVWMASAPLWSARPGQHYQILVCFPAMFQGPWFKSLTSRLSLWCMAVFLPREGAHGRRGCRHSHSLGEGALGRPVLLLTPETGWCGVHLHHSSALLRPQ